MPTLLESAINLEILNRRAEIQEERKPLPAATVDGLDPLDIKACMRSCRVHVYEWDGTPKVGSEVTFRLEHQTSVVDCDTETHRGALSSRRTTARTNSVGLVNVDLPVGVTSYWTIPDAGIYDAPLAIASGAGYLNIVDSLKTAGQVT